MKYASVFCINIQLLANVTTELTLFSARVSKIALKYANADEYMHIAISHNFR